MSRILQIGAQSLFHQNDADSTDDITTTVAADVLAIPVTHGYVAKTTGADAEALTLADGYNGQILVINLTTDGGGDLPMPATKQPCFLSMMSLAGFFSGPRALQHLRSLLFNFNLAGASAPSF
jgi:hypothetical protein